jgi:hypothetical protein
MRGERGVNGFVVRNIALPKAFGSTALKWDAVPRGGGTTHRHELLCHVKHVFQRGSAAREALNHGSCLLSSPTGIRARRSSAADREREAHADAALGLGAGHQLAA